MKKKTFVLLLSITLSMGIFTGCGNNKETETVSSKQEEQESKQEEPAKQENAKVEEEAETDKQEMEQEEITYREEKDIFVASKFDTTGESFNVQDWENYFEEVYRLPESIDIYSYWGTVAGYTKSDIIVSGGIREGEWIWLSFAESAFLVKAEDFDKVAVESTKEEYWAFLDELNGVEETEVELSEEEKQIQEALNLIDEDKLYTLDEFMELAPDVFGKVGVNFSEEIVDNVHAIPATLHLEGSALKKDCEIMLIFALYGWNYDERPWSDIYYVERESNGNEVSGDWYFKLAE